MEIRSYTELGAPKIGEGRTIEGYAVVFGQESRVMFDKVKRRAFVEVIERGAITEEILRSCDVKAVLEHNKQRLLARCLCGVGSLTLELDDYGLKYRFDAPNTVDGDFAVEMIKRGDIFGSSFAYFVNDKDKSKVTYAMKDGLLTRTVHKIDCISDISPVSDPAFFGTDVTVRSMDDMIAELNPENKEYLIELNNLRKQI
ncbi:HK97 family phage prohead protease [Phocaeicola sp.]